MKNYKEYIDYCQRLAEDVNDSRSHMAGVCYSDDIDVNDRIHEIADGCSHVIYYSKAWDLVNMMRVCNGQLFNQAIEDVQDEYCSFGNDINKHMTLIAYYLIRNGIHSAYQQLESEVVA